MIASIEESNEKSKEECVQTYRCTLSGLLSGSDPNARPLAIRATLDSGNNYYSAISPHVARKLGFDEAALKPLPKTVRLRSADKNHRCASWGRCP